MDVVSFVSWEGAFSLLAALVCVSYICWRQHQGAQKQYRDARAKQDKLDKLEADNEKLKKQVCDSERKQLLDLADILREIESHQKTNLNETWKAEGSEHIKRFQKEVQTSLDINESLRKKLTTLPSVRQLESELEQSKSKLQKKEKELGSYKEDAKAKLSSLEKKLSGKSDQIAALQTKVKLLMLLLAREQTHLVRSSQKMRNSLLQPRPKHLYQTDHHPLSFKTKTRSWKTSRYPPKLSSPRLRTSSLSNACSTRTPSRRCHLRFAHCGTRSTHCSSYRSKRQAAGMTLPRKPKKWKQDMKHNSGKCTNSLLT